MKETNYYVIKKKAVPEVLLKVYTLSLHDALPI